MGFENVVGQSPLMENLKKSLQKGRIVHAYLFSGPKGSGKKTVADLLAKALNCESGGDKPCDHCPSCLKYDTGNHPDVKRIRLEKSSIGVDEIRELQKDIYVKPYEGGKKIYIIENAESMTVQAQNGLLKTLEEPPPFGVIMLLAERTEGLLPTIQSRCQILRLSRVSKSEISLYLQERFGVAKDKADLYAGLSDGLVGRALEMATSNELMEKRMEFLKTLDEISRTDVLGVFSRGEYFTGNKDSIQQILDWMELWFRDLLIFKETEEMAFIINRDFREMLESHGKLFTLKALQDIIEMVSLCKKQLKGSANFQLTIENLLLNIVEVKHQ